jgi:hypothetical protein
MIARGLRAAFWAASCACAYVASGCGAAIAPAFDARFEDNDAAGVAAIAAELARAQAQPAAAPSLPNLLVATTHGADPSLIAYDLAQARVAWRVAVAAETRPELLGDLVVTTRAGKLLGFDAATGQLRVQADLDGCSYLGAANDAGRIFVACQPSGAQHDARLIAFDERSGHRLWQRTAHGEIGRPAARAGIVLVPWQRQSLALLDARSGRERARLRTHDDVIDWVRADRGGTFFGHRALYRLSADSAHVSRADAGRASVPSERLPGEPSAQASAFSPEPAARSARGRIALYLEPEAVGATGVQLARDRYYFVFYRYVFAFDASGALRFCRVLAHDVIAGQPVAAGLVLVQDSGDALLLAAQDGSERMHVAIGAALASATLRAGFDADGTAPARAGGASDTTALEHELTEIALDTDSRLVPARAYAVQALAKLDAPEVTRELLDIYSQSVTPPELKRVAADALRTRRSGLEYLIDALLARYDFLEQTRPAPLAVIAPALVDAHETRAVPRLLERLADHETPPSALPVLVHAIVELGDSSVVTPLLDWLRLYRNDSSFAEQPDALLEAARGVLVHGGSEGPALLASITQDGRAGAALAGGIASLLVPRAAQPVLGAAVAPATPKAAPLPEKLTQEAIDSVFAEHIDDLRACAIDEIGRNPELARLRIAFIAESDGATHALSFAPNTPELVDCLYSKVAAYRFPHFRAGRQVATYSFVVRAREQPTSPADDGGQHNFWDFYAAKADAAALPPETEPWWRSHQWLAPMIERSANDTSMPATASTADGSRATTAKQATAQPAAARSARANAPSPAAPAPSAASTSAPATRPAAEPAKSEPPAAPPTAGEDAWWLPANK